MERKPDVMVRLTVVARLHDNIIVRTPPQDIVSVTHLDEHLHLRMLWMIPMSWLS